MHAIADIYHQIPVGVWLTILGVIGSVITKLFSHWFSIQKDSVKTILFAAMSSALVLVDNLLNTVKANPSLLGGKAAATVGIGTVFYNVILKNGYNLMLDVKQLRDSQKTAVPSTVVDAPAADVGF